MLSLLSFLTIWTLVLTIEYPERKVDRLIGGHLKIYHEDSQDTELLTALATTGLKNNNNKMTTIRKGDEEEKKTLIQQIADGKYGLIQNELFMKPIKRPGLLSYEHNPEIPKDNINNLGGLSKNEIWLAENHLLIIKGGTYPTNDNNNNNNRHLDKTDQIWPAIDNYKAPLRQVKIPLNPKIPPPFPVQFTDNGPLQILGTNYTRTLNGTFNKNTYTISAYPTTTTSEQNTNNKPQLPYSYTSNITAGQSPFQISAYPPGEYNLGSPFPPSTPHQLNGTLPPFFASLPPGAAILPPPPPINNQTDLYDDDDPSIYYPPPYSFYYPKDNFSVVQPGPLVPGIILPPPPNFFAPLEEPSTTTKKMRKIIQTTTTPLPHIHPTTTPILPTVVNNERTRKPTRIYPIHIPSEIINELKPIVTTTTTPPPKIITILPVKHLNVTKIINHKRPSVTILKPVKSTTNKPSKLYVYNNEVSPLSNKPFELYGPPSKQRIKTIISTTQIPLKSYYSTSNEINPNLQTQSPIRKYVNRIPKTTPKPLTAQYYYYEEQPKETTTTTNYNNNNNQNYYKPSPPSQYIYVTARPYNNNNNNYRFVQQEQQQQQIPKNKDTFSIHIARLQKQINQYYTTPKTIYKSPHSSKPVYQFSFQAANYQSPSQDYKQQQQQYGQDRFRPIPKYSVQIQPAIEILPTQSPIYTNTPQPIFYNNRQQSKYKSNTERPVATNYYSTSNPEYEYDDNVQKSHPISQYSYEATQNPIYQGFYTKPDENYLDDNTKKYFTTFGKKIPVSTTAIPKIQRKPQQQQQQQQKPINLEGDILVNYLKPRPQINSEAEYINPQIKYQPKPQQQQQQQQQRQNQQKTKFVETVPITTAEGQPGSFISYQLPGDDGAHFYFLTPQLAQRRDQNSAFYYNTRISRIDEKDS